MRLAEQAAIPTGPAPRLEEAVAEVLDRRLRREARAPVALALSGGGDSTALLHAADAWARAAGRDLLVLTVDHRLQAAGADWARCCGEAAGRLGRPFQSLVWEGPKPASGLPAAARAARHRLLAEAARRAGARVLLLGHTADDVAEARAMRTAGSTTPEPREWSPSPAWPEGRGLFLLRPLLSVRREAIRRWLAERGLGWIEDPANEDLRFARARARAGRATDGPVAATVADDPALIRLALASEATDWGGLALARPSLREASFDTARAWVGAACLCAAGTTRPPRGARLDRLTLALRDEAPVVATLAGARLEAEAGRVLVMREAGEALRGGLAALAAPGGQAVVWDGRFEVTSPEGGRSVRPLAGLASRLSPPARRGLAGVPAGARGGLPVLIDAAGGVMLARDAAEVAPLAGPRLLAACGATSREPI